MYVICPRALSKTANMPARGCNEDGSVTGKTGFFERERAVGVVERDAQVDDERDAVGDVQGGGEIRGWHGRGGHVAPVKPVSWRQSPDLPKNGESKCTRIDRQVFRLYSSL
jgi:hypothetical protein